MAGTRTPLVTVVLGCVLLLGCQDDAEKLLSEAGVSEADLTQQRQEESATSLPTLDGPAETARPSEGDDIGRYEIAHDPSQAKLEIRFADLPPSSGIQNAMLWLTGANGPVSLSLEPCPGADPRCLAARSELLREPGLRGVLRFELNGQRCRVSLGTRKPETQPVPSGELASPTQPEPA